MVANILTVPRPAYRSGVDAAAWKAAHGLNSATLTDWGVTEEDDGSLLIPVRAANGEEAFRVRRNFVGPKYQFIPAGCRRGLVLYGLDRAQQISKECGLIVVEGFSDCLALHKKGLVNAVSILGSYMSKTQWALATAACGPDAPLIIWLDGDDAGKTHAIMMAKQLEKRQHPRNTIFMTYEGLDPAEWLTQKTGRSALFSKVIKQIGHSLCINFVTLNRMETVVEAKSVSNL